MKLTDMGYTRSTWAFRWIPDAKKPLRNVGFPRVSFVAGALFERATFGSPWDSWRLWFRLLPVETILGGTEPVRVGLPVFSGCCLCVWLVDPDFGWWRFGGGWSVEESVGVGSVGGVEDGLSCCDDGGG